MPVADLRRHRRCLHRLAEPSGQERKTASYVATQLAKHEPAALLTGLAGHGVAASITSPTGAAGPKVLLRAELDAVAVPEADARDPAAGRRRVAHKCGHDGHMAILLGVAGALASRPPTRGRVILLFQPAEETAAGAAALRADARFRALEPDWLFALHNLPGHALGHVVVRSQTFTAGSAGLRIRLRGRTAHAAQPELGCSPDAALAALIPALVALPVAWEKQERLCLVTVTHARLGEPTFGVAPGEAEILATLRADDDEVLAALRRDAAELALAVARRHGLDGELSWEEVFPVTWNDPAAVAVVKRASVATGLRVVRPHESPFRWSEDFGVLARLGRGALFGLGAGRRHPVLHAENYDFNDELLQPGVELLIQIVRELTESDPWDKTLTAPSQVP